MATVAGRGETKVTGIAPQFLVDDLDRAIACYCEKLGFELDFVYQSFYAAVSRDGAAPSTSSMRRRWPPTGNIGNRMSTWTPIFPCPELELCSANCKIVALT